MPTPPAFPDPGSAKLKVLNTLTNANVRLYRLSGGKLGGKSAGAPILLLDHVGRKSGQKRTTPLMYTRDGDDLIVVASRAGSNFNPAWWSNLKASPATTIQVGSERLSVLARQATPEEKEELWPRLVANYRHYATYEERTDREIPVIVLTPQG